MIITNLNPGNFTTDGVYTDQIPQLPAVNGNAPTGRVGISGTANWGPLNTPIAFSKANVDGFQAFGDGTYLPKSLILAALVMMPECIDFLGTRVDDGTSTAAVITMQDSSAGSAIVLTARYTGSKPNPTTATLANPTMVAAAASATLQSGTASANPVAQVIVNFPGFPQEVYSNIVAYATPGGGIDIPTYRANVLAAMNGTAPNTAPSPNWIASNGTGTHNPVFDTAYSASGGTDGATSVTAAIQLGTLTASTKTGAYAMDGKLSGAQIVLADLTDTAVAAGIQVFETVENCIAHFAFATNATTATAIASRQTNNLKSAGLVLSMDWDYFYDSVLGLTKLVCPSYKTAAVIASQPAFMYPGNKPQGGVAGITTTQLGSNGVGVAEGGQRQTNGLLYLTDNPQLFFGSGYGLPHGMAADGITPISDVRMLKMISNDLYGIVGPLVGLMQSGDPDDPTRVLYTSRVGSYLKNLRYGSPRQIADSQVIADLTDNSTVTIAAGKLIGQISVTTLAPVKYIVNLLQVGVNVQIVTQRAA